MSRKIMMGIVAILMTGLLVAPSMAGKSKVKAELKPGEKGPSGWNIKSNVGHLYLYQKDSEVLDEYDGWTIVEDGMWGKMKYNLSGPTFDFVFNGHGLEVGMEYTLIYYPDKAADENGNEEWPRTGVIWLGDGVVTNCEIVENEAGVFEEVCSTDGPGNIHIKGSIETDTNLPAAYDFNATGPVTGYKGVAIGAKIFLVPTSDVGIEGQTMDGWSQELNLYEGALIFFDDTDIPN